MQVGRQVSLEDRRSAQNPNEQRWGASGSGVLRERRSEPGFCRYVSPAGR
jgi:hypothetical protein